VLNTQNNLQIICDLQEGITVGALAGKNIIIIIVIIIIITTITIIIITIIIIINHD